MLLGHSALLRSNFASGRLEGVDDIERLDPRISTEVFGEQAANSSFKAGRDE
jgi:hypothetical protein